MDGPRVVISIYAPPELQVPYNIWMRFFEEATSYGSLIVGGDFNAHSCSWGATFNFPRGSDLVEIFDILSLLSLNDSEPTRIDRAGKKNNNLDLILISDTLIAQALAEVTGDLYGSDHLLVISRFDLSPKYVSSSSTRINFKNLDWAKIEEPLRAQVSDLEKSLKKVLHRIKYIISLLIHFCPLYSNTVPTGRNHFLGRGKSSHFGGTMIALFR